MALQMGSQRRALQIWRQNVERDPFRINSINNHRSEEFWRYTFNPDTLASGDDDESCLDSEISKQKSRYPNQQRNHYFREI